VHVGRDVELAGDSDGVVLARVVDEDHVVERALGMSRYVCSALGGVVRRHHDHDVDIVGRR